VLSIDEDFMEIFFSHFSNLLKCSTKFGLILIFSIDLKILSPIQLEFLMFYAKVMPKDLQKLKQGNPLFPITVNSNFLAQSSGK